MLKAAENRCHVHLGCSRNAIEGAFRALQRPPKQATMQADPCQGIRDALATEQAAVTLLQTALANAQAVVMQLEMDLMDCENPAP